MVKHWAGLLAISIGIFGTFGTLEAKAQLAFTVKDTAGQTQAVTGRNVPRGDESLVLYDAHYGASTRTNGYGVEVVAVPANPTPAAAVSGRIPAQPPLAGGKLYKVIQKSSVWECQRQDTQQQDTQQQQQATQPKHPLTCGNSAIPPQGIVLSAMGKKREWLNQLQPGDSLIVEEKWFQQQESPLAVINPTPSNNPMASGFPGYRASNQLVMYNAQYARPTTGTNEFGFEVTVRNGIVVAQEGSDSAIPFDGFVLSGHGKARSWLIAHAPLGAHIEISPAGDRVIAVTDFNTYAYQFDQQWAQSPCSENLWGTVASSGTKAQACLVIRDEKEQAIRLNKAGNPQQAAETLQAALQKLYRQTWQAYHPFPENSVRGAWHRPVEKDAASIGNTLDGLKASGLNAVFLETYFHGYTIFPSQTFTSYGLPAENPKFGQTDLLQAWVSEAHKRNMKVHVWFQTFYGGTNAYLPPGPILTKYPNWANVQYAALIPVEQPAPTEANAKGNPTSTATAPGKTQSVNLYTAKPNIQPVAQPAPIIMKAPAKPTASNLELGAYFLDPANPQVQTFLLKLVEEIVTRYDVDGLQLDYIRYPASFPADRYSYRKTTWGYTDVARTAFKGQYGIDPVNIDPKNPQFENLWRAWNAYKVAQISNFVNKASHLIHQKKPGVQVSAAVFPDASSALNLKHQDWQSWALNGWIDFFAPMTLTSAAKVVERDTRNMITLVQHKVPVYSGLFGPFNENTAEHLLSQIDSAQKAGAAGYVLFDTAHITNRMHEALKTMQLPEPEVSAPVEPDASSLPVQPAEKPKKRHWWWFR